MILKKMDKQIAAYLFTAFLLPLLCASLIGSIPFFGSGYLQMIIYGLEAAAPALAAVFTVYIFEKKSGLRNFLIRKYTAPLRIGIVFLALILPIMILFLSSLLSGLRNHNAFRINSLSFMNMIIFIWALVAEELGWRGFLQERLDQHIRWFAVPVLTGFVWAAWHYHFFMNGTSNIPIPLFVLGCILESYIYYPLVRLSKGNVIPASVYHFSGNLFINLFFIYPKYNNGSLFPYSMYLVLSFVTAILLNYFFIIKKSKTGSQ